VETPAFSFACVKSRDGQSARLSPPARWTDGDVDALRDEFRDLTHEQQTQVMPRYAVAVNQGRIAPQADGERAFHLV
jgi:hypothetical protein